MIRSKEITPNNWRLGLKIAEAQQTYASNDTKILARAYAYSNHKRKPMLYIMMKYQQVLVMAMK